MDSTLTPDKSKDKFVREKLYMNNSKNFKPLDSKNNLQSRRHATVQMQGWSQWYVQVVKGGKPTPQRPIFSKSPAKVNNAYNVESQGTLQQICSSPAHQATCGHPSLVVE